MDLDRLRTLRELSLRKTMAAVAEALLISPSAVSQQIGQLEEEAGIELVERRGRGVSLTPAGRRLVGHAEKIVGILEEAKTDIAEFKRIVAGELRVSAFPSVAAALIPQTIMGLGRLHPELRIKFLELEPTDSWAALRAWQTDVALVDDLTILTGVPEATVETVHVVDDRLFAMLPLKHALSDRPHVTLRDLSEESWALDTASNTYSEVIVRACREVGFEPTINGNCHGFEVIRSLIEAGCSVSIQPGLRVRDYAGGVCVKEIVPPIPRRISAAFRKGERRNPSVSAFLSALADVAAGLPSHDRFDAV